MATLIAVLAALTAACAFGVAVTVQHDVASTGVEGAALRLRLLARLATRPRWALAVMVQAVSYGVQAIALAYGPIALVAPLSATDLLFALPLMARRRQRLGVAEWTGAACIAGGSFLGRWSLCGLGRRACSAQVRQGTDRALGDGRSRHLRRRDCPHEKLGGTAGQRTARRAGQ